MGHRAWLLGFAVSTAALVATREAKAEGTLALDGHATALFFRSGTQASLGGALYGGYVFRVSKLYVGPEAALGVDDLPNVSLLDVRATGGLRLGLAFKVEPSIYAHVGGAFFKPLRSGLISSLQGTFTVDAGLGLDFRPAKFFTIGLTAGYQGYFGSFLLGTVHGISVAPRIGFWF